MPCPQKATNTLGTTVDLTGSFRSSVSPSSTTSPTNNTRGPTPPSWPSPPLRSALTRLDSRPHFLYRKQGSPTPTYLRGSNTSIVVDPLVDPLPESPRVVLHGGNLVRRAVAFMWNPFSMRARSPQLYVLNYSSTTTSTDQYFL